MRDLRAARVAGGHLSTSSRTTVCPPLIPTSSGESTVQISPILKHWVRENELRMLLFTHHQQLQCWKRDFWLIHHATASIGAESIYERVGHLQSNFFQPLELFEEVDELRNCYRFKRPLPTKQYTFPGIKECCFNSI
jgi:hypothetical protein